MQHISYQTLNDWVRKNWFTVVGIIIISIAVLVDINTVQQQRMKVGKECNDYWFQQVKAYCPAILQNGAQYDLNFSNIEIQPIVPN